MKPHHAGRMILQGLKSACAFCRRAAQSIAADTRVRSAAPYVPLLAVLLGTALLYLPVLSADFVTFDDNAYVVENPDLRTPNLAQILDPRHLTVSDWTPVVTVSHVAEYQLFGLAPAAYHATNLLLHLGCILLVYVVLSDLQIGRLEAVLGALIFAIHPLQVESVAWVASRKNLLAALFGLAFLHTFLTGRGGRALVLLAVALGSKGTAVVFPVWAMVAAWR